MNRRLTLLFAFLVAACPPEVLRADSVTLKSGHRIEGEIVEETAVEIMLRRRFGTGGITYVQPIKRTNIESFEKSPLPVTSAPASAPTTRATRPALIKKNTIADKPAFLRDALKKWSANDPARAGVALTRLINNSTTEELQELSTEVERQLEMPLAELAAEAHFIAARRTSRGRAIRLSYVTTYELPALVQRLIEAYHAAIEESVQAIPDAGKIEMTKLKRVETQPAAEDENADFDERKPVKMSRLSIAAWVDRPDKLDLKRAEAAALVRQIQYANSLLNERIRLDAAVRKDRLLKSKLLQERIRLVALAKIANGVATGAIEPMSSSMTFGPDPDADRDHVTGKEKIDRAELEKQAYLQKALRLAQEQAQQAK